MQFHSNKKLNQKITHNFVIPQKSHSTIDLKNRFLRNDKL